jgi:hypothetical protein
MAHISLIHRVHPPGTYRGTLDRVPADAAVALLGRRPFLGVEAAPYGERVYVFAREGAQR